MKVGLVCTRVTESGGIASRPGTNASWLAWTSGVYAASVNTGPAIIGATGSGRVIPAITGTRAAARLATVERRMEAGEQRRAGAVQVQSGRGRQPVAWPGWTNRPTPVM